MREELLLPAAVNAGVDPADAHDFFHSFGWGELEGTGEGGGGAVGASAADALEACQSVFTTGWGLAPAGWNDPELAREFESALCLKVGSVA